MTGADTAPAGGAPTPAPAAGRSLRPWIAGLAGAALAVVPPTEPVSLAGVGLALLVLFLALRPRATDAGGAGGAPAAGAGGALLVLGLFAAANPWTGVLAPHWPWTLHSLARPWPARADLILAFLVGLLAFAVGVTRPRRAGPWVAVLALGLFLAARGYGDDAGFRLARLDRPTFAWACGACALGAGLLHLASARRERRGVARGLVLLGVLAIAVVHLAWFTPGEGGPAWSVSTIVEEGRRAFRALVLGEEQDALMRREVAERAFVLVVPALTQALALLLGLFAAASPSRAGGRAGRTLALIAWLVLLLAWLVPAKAGAWYFHDRSGLETPAFVSGHVSGLLLGYGLAAWLVSIGAVGALLARPSAARSGERPHAGTRTYAPRWGYVTGALLLLVMVVRSFQPGSGAVLAEGVLAVFRPLRWDPAAATLALQALVLLTALTAAMLPAGAGRGALVAASSLVAWAILTPLSTRDYGLEGYVPLAVLATATGALRAGASLGPSGSGVARRTAGAAGGILLLLLLYPLAVPAPGRGGTHVFQNAILEFTRGWGGDENTSAHVAATASWRVGVVVDATVALLAVAFAIRGRAAGARVAVAAFLLDLAYTCLWPGVVDFQDVKTSLLLSGDALRVHGVPMAILMASAVRDLHSPPWSAGGPPVLPPAREGQWPGGYASP